MFDFEAYKTAIAAVIEDIVRGSYSYQANKNMMVSVRELIRGSDQPKALIQFICDLPKVREWRDFAFLVELNENDAKFKEFLEKGAKINLMQFHANIKAEKDLCGETYGRIRRENDALFEQYKRHEQYRLCERQRELIEVLRVFFNRDPSSPMKVSETDSSALQLQEVQKKAAEIGSSNSISADMQSVCQMLAKLNITDFGAMGGVIQQVKSLINRPYHAAIDAAIKDIVDGDYPKEAKSAMVTNLGNLVKGSGIPKELTQFIYDHQKTKASSHFHYFRIINNDSIDFSYFLSCGDYSGIDIAEYNTRQAKLQSWLVDEQCDLVARLKTLFDKDFSALTRVGKRPDGIGLFKDHTEPKAKLLLQQIKATAADKSSDNWATSLFNKFVRGRDELIESLYQSLAKMDVGGIESLSTVKTQVNELIAQLDRLNNSEAKVVVGLQKVR